jgi:hypothetical protein
MQQLTSLVDEHFGWRCRGLEKMKKDEQGYQVFRSQRQIIEIVLEGYSIDECKKYSRRGV